VEIAERLAGDVSIAGRLKPAAAARRPVVSKHRPRAVLVRLKVDLNELAGCVAAHDDVKEDFVSGRLEEPRLVDEGHVDAVRIIGVGMDDRVAASRQPRIERVDEQIDDEAVLDLADAEQVRAGTCVHLRAHRRELGDFAVPARRSPAGKIGADRALQLLRAARRVLLVKEVLQIPPGDVVRRGHLSAHSPSHRYQKQAPGRSRAKRSRRRWPRHRRTRWGRSGCRARGQCRPGDGPGGRRTRSLQPAAAMTQPIVARATRWRFCLTNTGPMIRPPANQHLPPWRPTPPASQTTADEPQGPSPLTSAPPQTSRLQRPKSVRAPGPAVGAPRRDPTERRTKRRHFRSWR
jgi:hypothetical protein